MKENNVMDGVKLQIDQSNAQLAKASAANVNAQERASDRPSVVIKTGGTTNRIVYAGGTVTQSSEAATGKGTNAPITQVDAPSRANNSSVVTGTSLNGRALSGDQLQNDSKINIAGMDTTVAGAQAAGLITRNAAGVFEYTAKARDLGHKDAAPTQQQQQQQQQQREQPSNTDAKANEQTPPAADVSKLDNDGEGLLSQFNSKVPSHEFQGAVNEVISSNGQISQDVIDLAAKRLGVSHEYAASQAAQLQAAFQRSADAAVGPHAALVWEHGWQNSPEQMRTLVSDFINYGKTSGLKDLANQYQQNLDRHNGDMILNSPDGQKLNARREKDGRISIEHPTYGRVGWSSALKAGLFTTNFFKL